MHLTELHNSASGKERNDRGHPLLPGALLGHIQARPQEHHEAVLHRHGPVPMPWMRLPSRLLTGGLLLMQSVASAALELVRSSSGQALQKVCVHHSYVQKTARAPSQRRGMAAVPKKGSQRLKSRDSAHHGLDEHGMQLEVQLLARGAGGQEQPFLATGGQNPAVLRGARERVPPLPERRGWPVARLQR